ncbi:hypothetical protein [Streptosporangium sp. G12]
MDGPFHFREAERLIEEANHVGHNDPQRGDGILLAAHVHATLALAAATALTGSMAAQSYIDEPEIRAWHEAAGVEPEPSSEPGQVEPEPAGIRVIQVEPGALVTYSEWNGGEPVKILDVAGAGLEGRLVAVRYTFFGVPGDDETVVVSADTLVTPYGGA